MATPLTYNNAFHNLKQALQPLYDDREATAIAHEVLYFVTGLSKLDRLVQKDNVFTPEQRQRFETSTADLLTGKPLQYVTGTAWFMGWEYKVDRSVLIPRPETEELVQWIIDDTTGMPSIIDIGTGSGCIPISLKLALPKASVTSCDVSGEALDIARQNATALNADVQFELLNFLNSSERARLPMYDIIVSNPPYIPISEKETLHPNVRDNEPFLALFVPVEDALIFYRIIAKFGLQHLNKGGAIYCEIHSTLADATKQMFEEAGYEHVELRADMNGNLRMIKVQ